MFNGFTRHYFLLVDVTPTTLVRTSDSNSD
jgi:hypothetical protein